MDFRTVDGKRNRRFKSQSRARQTFRFFLQQSALAETAQSVENGPRARNPAEAFRDRTDKNQKRFFREISLWKFPFFRRIFVDGHRLPQPPYRGEPDIFSTFRRLRSGAPTVCRSERATDRWRRIRRLRSVCFLPRTQAALVEQTESKAALGVIAESSRREASHSRKDRRDKRMRHKIGLQGAADALSRARRKPKTVKRRIRLWSFRLTHGFGCCRRHKQFRRRRCEPMGLLHGKSAERRGCRGRTQARPDYCRKALEGTACRQLRPNAMPKPTGHQSPQ